MIEVALPEKKRSTHTLNMQALLVNVRGHRVQGKFPPVAPLWLKCGLTQLPVPTVVIILFFYKMKLRIYVNLTCLFYLFKGYIELQKALQRLFTCISHLLRYEGTSQKDEIR